ncbi:MAG: leucyl/phenylalanyl-tRNA--protein transferase [Zetaproteobacteria bacterium]|nr:leucyl/phenylalanyl-tRNA--protein transferase [Pseudobdellovibrionaceae bacterium]
MNDQLSPKVLYQAYCQGYFPMPDHVTNEIFWYRPDPRAIFPLDKFRVSRSLQKVIRKKFFEITFNQAFNKVIHYCGSRKESWITKNFINAYTELHNLNQAHSVEVWLDGELVGGVYGVHIGSAFFAESMFFRASNASKVALYFLIEKLKEKNFFLLECQFMTDHLKSLGAEEISDKDYIRLLQAAINKASLFT